MLPLIIMLVLSSPIHYYLELTSDCNNLCVGCGNVLKYNKGPSLSADQWLKIFNKISSHTVHLRLSGGEPTLHPEFEYLIGLINKTDISFTIFTNGRWHNPERIISFLHNITGNEGLLVSIHGDTPSIHEAFTQVKNSFTDTVQNIKRAGEAGINVATSTIITSLNYNRIDKLIAFTENLRVDKAFFARYLPVQNHEITPTDDQLGEAIYKIEKHRENGAKVEFSVCIPLCFAPSSSEGCLAGVTYCVIDPWGNVRPCTHTPLICGNLLEQSVEEIWHGPEMQRWRDMIPVQCHSCLEFSKCHGGCRAAAMIEGLEKDPLMCEPILEKLQEPPEELMLYEAAYPVSHFTVRSESFGYILIRGNHVTPVAHQAKPILDTLNGCLNLRQIRERFGQEGLDFVGSLYQKGLLEMREKMHDNQFSKE
ncbi:MAG: radical SAM protein [Desulfobacterales bacterium]|nr:radical SAM protein [Desulfobacterales bacterium]